ncbi:hypothetical protein [Desulfosporosinus youngiae]|uniref:Uncharacterized protein n=1 Tax=Desulfosporosinus youngiae DSM 17734 TaxID=768710 RepID=H5XZX9_9FIRM|nr:hypothetical protein [Desulfosporosinus youngiae]EHQ92175.1 hypothetical protein DesyoDRAFT_5246 [Desulfosporosinus youngiae DSM 17734]
MSLYVRFISHLQTCGGCTGLRDYQQCRFAIVCAHVEKLSMIGVIRSSKDFCYPVGSSDPMSYSTGCYLPGAAAINQAIPAGVGPCNAD